MSSATTEAEVEAKLAEAGRAPAVKMAGGVRVMQHKHETTKTNTKEDKEAEANAPVNPNAALVPDAKFLAGGALLKESVAFPKEAFEAFHNKPVPTATQKHAPQQHVQINQPRKM